MKHNRVFFPNLDGLRFVAFLMVFVWHSLKIPLDLLLIDHPWLHHLFYTFLNGKTGVSIFFVLSGFLITYLMLAEQAMNEQVDVVKFYIRRGLRIWPLYFLILLLVFIVLPVLFKIFQGNWEDFDMQPIYYFLFAGNFDVLQIYLANGKDFLPATITWSVAIEEQFYLVWPLLFVLLPARYYKFIFPVLVVICYGFRSVQDGNIAVLNFHTVSVCGDFALGGWAAYNSINNQSFLQFFECQRGKIRLAIYVGGMAGLYLLQVQCTDLLQVFGRLFQTVFFAYIILDQNFSLQTTFKFGNNRLISFWGKYTYGLYLWHPIVLLGITILLTRILNASMQHFSTHLLIAGIGFLGSMAVSYCSYHCFERFFLKIKNRFASITT